MMTMTMMMNIDDDDDDDDEDDDYDEDDEDDYDDDGYDESRAGAQCRKLSVSLVQELNLLLECIFGTFSDMMEKYTSS